MQFCQTNLTWLWLSAALAAWSPWLSAQDATPPDKEPVSAVSIASQPPRLALPQISKSDAARPSIGDPKDTHLDRTPPRQTKHLDLVKMGWTYNCMECHKLLTAKWHYDRPMVEHENIRLQHGNNRYCLNCHHPTNRNAFVDYDGAEIAEADVVQLCAKCHGPTYRDWQAGVHGRRNGFWEKQKGPQTQLRCIQCHDPHQPAFQPIKPLAPLRYPPRAAGAPNSTTAVHEKGQEHP